MHVSPLGRAQQRAAIIRAHGTYTSSVDEPRIQEVTTGAWDGLTHADIEAGWPGLLDGATTFDWYFRAPEGEAYEAAVTRVRSWLDAVDGSVVAVSHGLVGRLVRGAYLGLPREEALALLVPQDVVWHFAHGRVEALAAWRRWPHRSVRRWTGTRVPLLLPKSGHDAPAESPHVLVAFAHLPVSTA